MKDTKVTKPVIKVTDDLTPYRLIRVMNETFEGVPGYSEKPTQYGYSVRKAGTVKSFKSPEGKWMIKAEDAQAYLEAYYQRNLAPENTAKGNAETKPALAKV
jgi:hypothetical protein